MSSRGVQEGSRVSMVAMSVQLFLFITHLGTGPCHREAEPVELCCIMMEPNRSAAPLGSPENLQSLAPTIMKFPLEDQHLLGFNDAVQWFEMLQMLVFTC